ncbi:DR2241 family protein [Luteolibacter sp. Populi]|uniref:DR2241 family protein n=1 Tax=Luteolibacter sp. Populi TaxID=3230487 RepID=UPI003465CD75
MKTAERLAQAVAGGVHRIGQIAIRPRLNGHGYEICHIDDEGLSPAALDFREGPAAARTISTWAADGHYRFTKGELTLVRGWMLVLHSAEELQQALDAFYPAAAGLWFAQQDGRLEVEHLRDKLNRQTGMYRFARNLSDGGAQRLVQEVCGPGHCCVKKILWQLDATTPLEDSEASRFDGVVGEINRRQAIPLLCREACNHFVAEARKASKAEATK